MKRIFIITTIIIITGFYMKSFFSKTPTVNNDIDRLRIITANIEYRNENPQKSSNNIFTYSPDIIVLLEWTVNNFDASRFIENGYNVLVNSPQIPDKANPKKGAHGIGIIVKKDISLAGGIIETPIKGPYQMPYGLGRVKVHGKTMTIVAVHAPPPISQWTTKPTVDYVLSKIKEGKLKTDWGVGKMGDEVIVLGDFNILSIDPYLNKIKEHGLYDTYSAVSKIPGPTWAYKPFLPKIFRIDYILCPQQFKTYRSQIIYLEGSDHNAVMSDIKIN